MKTEQIHFRVHKEQKAAILEASKGSSNLTDWILGKLIPGHNLSNSQVDEPIVKTLEIKVPKRRCMAPYCKSLETTSKLVHGTTVWLCSTHYDKG